MDPQTDLYGNTIHEDIGGNRYIHDGYGQRNYLDQPSSEPTSSGGSGGGWLGGDSGGGGGGGGGDSPSGGGSGGGGGGNSGPAAGCSGIMTLLLMGMCLYCGFGQYLQKAPPQLLPRQPQPTDSPPQPTATAHPADASTASSVPPAETGNASRPTEPAAVPSNTPGAKRQDWHGKLQLVERHPRTGAVKNSSKWTDIKIAVERTSAEVIGEIHFVEANVFAAVRGRIQEPNCQLIVDRVLSGPRDAVVVPCVLTGKLDAKQVYRGHWNAGLAGSESSQHPRFWLSAGLEQ
ncbi:MAG TPA: hypothetical protein VFG20_02215 [Planctomycetaceae bacterium]|nr:hypothetical protein [Planctomycetaceae bacterium]